MKFTNQQFVRWDDIDAFGHVNNAKYLTYIQEARFQWSYYEQKKLGDNPSLVEMVVARNEIDYLAPIYEGGRLYNVEIWVESIGNTSFVLNYVILGEDGTVHAKAKSVQVAIDMASKKSRPITDVERAFLNRYTAE